MWLISIGFPGAELFNKTHPRNRQNSRAHPCLTGPPIGKPKSRRASAVVIDATDAIAADTGKSDRAIAEEIGVSDRTVNRAHASTGTHDPVETRTGIDGKTRRLPQRRGSLRM